MQNFIAGQDLTLYVLFVDGTETVVPDVGTVTYDLYDNGGSSIASAVSVPATSTQFDIPLDASLNGKDADKDFELRTLVLHYKVSGKPVEQVFTYRLVDFVSLSVNADSCRALLGLSRDELSDNDLDLMAAYWAVRDDISDASMTAALAAGNMDTVNVNRMIAVQALLDILGSIELRTKQSDKSNTTQVARFSKVDFVALRQWLVDLYSNTRTTLLGTDSSLIGAGLMIVATKPTTDPITGQAPSIT